MINRTLTKIINETTKHTPVTLVTGPRQTGKSTLLKFLLNNKNFGYISLDNNEWFSKAKYSPRDFLKEHPYPLIIDEVQKVPELLPAINEIVNASKMSRGNEQSNGMYILSGSNRATLLEKSSESLAGRMIMIDMWPLSLSEIYNRDTAFFDVDKVENLKSRSENLRLSELQIFQHIFRGFMPNLYSDPKLDEVTYYQTYITSVIQKDILPCMQIKDITKFYEFIKLLASNIGQELVYETYAKALTVSPTTVRNWVDILVRVKIIHLLKPYNEFSFTKRVIKRPKMYFFDTGLAAALLRIDSVETLMKSYLKGRFFECFVVNELMKSFSLKSMSNNLYYYRDDRQHEVDLVYLSKGKINCIEIKCGSTFTLKDIESASQLKASKFGLGKRIIISSASEVINFEKDNFIIIPATSI